MISAVETRKGTEAITSDHWHVVHSRFLGKGARRPFLRSISSEHDDRTSCVKAARELLAKIRPEIEAVPLAERDQVFVRRPGFKSVKASKRRVSRRTPPAPSGDA
jgi:hypothetical protein